MENREDLLGVLQVLYRWRKPILFTTMAAALLSIVIALILPKYYQSATTFYAASPDLNKPDIVFGDINTNFDYYGSDADIDRILTIAQSNELVDYMVDSFRLYEAYDIDPDNSKAPHYVELNFQKLYNVIRTPFDAILLEIEDKDPALSARMVEAARGKINEIATGLIRS
ncbi:MAG: hypothetical protein KJP00_03065, partial [Bacteroidia bacterium]|nr:hypothetical protein [Bacteroidia bacterium]